MTAMAMEMPPESGRQRESHTQGERMPQYREIKIIDIPVDQLRKSPGNKRRYDEHRAARYAAHFDDFQAGTPHVSHRDNHDWVIDGWHRVGAARLAGRKTIRCLVIYGYTEADEAKAFDLLNTERIRISAGDEFWSRIDWGEPTAALALATCDAAGIEMLPIGESGAASGSSARRADACRAYGAVQTITARFGADVLRDTILSVRAAWPDDPRALDAQTLLWVSSFIGLYQVHPYWSRAQFVSRLSGLALSSLVQRVRAYEGVMGISKGGGSYGSFGGPATRNVLLVIYNKGVRSRKLPEASAADLKRRSLGQNPWASR